jgi:hypothetical protein
MSFSFLLCLDCGQACLGFIFGKKSKVNKTLVFIALSVAVLPAKKDLAKDMPRRFGKKSLRNERGKGRNRGGAENLSDKS